jgi:diguanylate cyclase (GGDEF)-like protein/PAS domain S-box-containing protein
MPQTQNSGTPRMENDWPHVLFQSDCPPMYLYDAVTSALLEANHAALRRYGYSREEFLGMRLSDIIVDARTDGSKPTCGGVIQQHRNKDGSTIYSEIWEHAAKCEGRDTVLVIARDVVPPPGAAKPARQDAADLNVAQGIARIGSWTWNVAETAMDWSDEASHIYGYAPGAISPDRRLARMGVHPDDRMAVGKAIRDALEGKHSYDSQHRIILPDGRVRIVHERGEVRRDDAGQPLRMTGTVEDVTEQCENEERLNGFAYFDDVTGLPNRRKFRILLDQALQAAQQQGPRIVVLIIQLARLRDINFTLGPASGDLLLRQVGPRLKELLPQESPIARIGDVQFATLLTGASTFTAAHVAEHMIDALNRPFDVSGVSFAPGAHVGAALYPAHGTSQDALIQHATVAAFQASRSGKNFVVYSAANDPYKTQRLAMLGEFRHAVESGQLVLYCQPKALIATGAVIAAEALVRWRHPQYGLVSPADFIPLIEPTELVQPLTEWMLENAISQCYRWRERGIVIPLAVNLSARNLQERNLAELINDLLITWSADTSWLDLEITESSIMADPVVSKAVLDQLHQYGFRLFVDDYGSGYSSLGYLMRLPVQFIKIDHSFVIPMLQDRPAAAIVKSAIELAHNLGMKVVAEGVASQGIWEALKPLHCDEAQGNYVGPPMPADEFGKWLEAHADRKGAGAIRGAA